MKPSVPSLLLPRPHPPLRFNTATQQQLRRATVLHHHVLPLSPSSQIRSLQQDQQDRSRAQTGPSVIDKYRAKLARKAEEAGIGGDGDHMDALRDAYRNKIDALRRDAVFANAPPEPRETLPPAAPTSSTTSPSSPSPTLPTKETTARQPATAVKPLSSILDLDKIRLLPDTELSAIWRLRHARSGTSLCATIPSRTYRAMEAVARRTSPHFVLPVPRDEEEGAELHFLQWTFGSGDGSRAGAPATTSTVLFTSLAEYKLRGEFAQPHTTLTHHLDLVDERGLVLMEGQVVDGRGTTVDQARWLAMCLQRFYGALPDAEVDEAKEPEAVALGRRNRRQLVEWFGKGDSRFSVDMLMAEAQRVG